MAKKNDLIEEDKYSGLMTYFKSQNFKIFSKNNILFILLRKGWIYSLRQKFKTKMKRSVKLII